MFKPIETTYKAHRFRSRLEARWAVFLDDLGVRWEYEPNGYELGDGVRYLPDFLLTEMRCWLEIKGSEGSYDQDADVKARKLADASGMPVFVFYGGHVLPTHDVPDDTCQAQAFFPDAHWDNRYFFCECPDCGLVGIQYDARADRLPCKADSVQWWDHIRNGAEKPAGCPRHGLNCDKGYNGASPRLYHAYAAARAARFGAW